MSKNSESKLPGELNENWGSNAMLDGFWHDMEYKHGIRDSIGKDPIPQPATSGMAQLPDGVLMAGDFDEALEVETQEAEGAMDLEGLGIVARLAPDVDRSDVGIIDHSWLADAFQDPDRLPDQPVDNGIPSLQEAWGDRTDGIQRVDLYDRAAVSYEDAMQHEEDDDSLHRDKFANFVRVAMRRSAAGIPIETIKHELIQQLGPEDARRIAKPVRAIELEHGLTGNVYVRASAYPRLQHGKWAKELKKAARGCRYLVATEGEDCQSCATVLGLELVATPNEIEWLKELSRYAPELQATRQDPKTASNNPREHLRGWFLAASRSPRLDIETAKVKHTMPADRVSSEEAHEAVAAQAAPEREQITNVAREQETESRKLQTKLGALVKANLISVEEAEKLFESKAPVMLRLRMAHLLAARTKKVEYAGPDVKDARVGISAEDYAETADSAKHHHRTACSAEAVEDAYRGKLLEGFTRIEQRLQQVREKVAKVVQAVKDGTVGAALRKLVDSLLDAKERKLFATELDPILVRGGYFEKATTGSREYEDAIVREAVPQAASGGISPQEVARVVRWARQQMSEGTAGPDLDQILGLRLDPRVMTAANEALTQVREQHEGLSGHLYVDAEAYATPKVIKGCEEGARLHRANQLKFVFAMDRCAVCVYKNADNICQKYNKVLLTEVPSEEREKLRQANLASHRMTDQEQTAALFATGAEATAEATDFDLHNAVLDDIETEPPSYEGIDGIFFGGFEV